MNLDDISHIDFLHPGRLAGARVLPLQPGPSRTGNVLIGDPKEAKFGTTTEQLLEGYRRCKELGVKRFGLHAMVVSNCRLKALGRVDVKGGFLRAYMGLGARFEG